MMPALWNEHRAGIGVSYTADRRITQGPCVNAARSFQKQRLDSGTGDCVSCGRLTTAPRVERLLWDCGRAKAESVSWSGATREDMFPNNQRASWPCRQRCACKRRIGSDVQDGSATADNLARKRALTVGGRAMPIALDFTNVQWI